MTNLEAHRSGKLRPYRSLKEKVIRAGITKMHRETIMQGLSKKLKFKIFWSPLLMQKQIWVCCVVYMTEDDRRAAGEQNGYPGMGSNSKVETEENRDEESYLADKNKRMGMSREGWERPLFL